jgi:glycosyltransferase involved in cell wall biosynthesis
LATNSSTNNKFLQKINNLIINGFKIFQVISKPYPKVLIFNETFKSNTGGGITLSNLFKGWPKECLANALDAKDISEIHSDEICNNFYSIGSDEKKTIKIFSFLQKKYKSGPYIFQSIKINCQSSNNNKIRNKLVAIFFDLLHFLGLYHTLYQYKLSKELKIWIQTFKPDFIYAQLETLALIRFTDELVSFSGAKLCIHMMDDWPTTISKTGFLKNFWNKKIDNEFRALLQKASVLMSISIGMTEAYLERYQKKFVPFHNPIEIEDWLPYNKKDLSIKNNEIKILYAGRIGLGTSTSLLSVAAVIEELKSDGVPVTFQIQTTTKENLIREKLNFFSCVHINEEVNYSKLPSIFSNVDILLLPIDFSEKGIKFLRYSMPTKVSEFMISGTPILLYCSPEVSLLNHAKKHQWAYIVSENNKSVLKKQILELLVNLELRKKLSKKAIDYACKNYSSNIVREKFKNEFFNNMLNI